MGTSLFGGLLILVALLLGPGLLVSVLWSPVLAIGRFRRLFRRLPFTDSTLVNYLIVSLGFSIPWLFGLRAALTFDPGRLAVIGWLAAGYAFGMPLLAGLGLPRLGIDWDPTRYGASTWVLLFFGSSWYAIVLAVPLTAIAVFRACSGQCLY